MKYTRVLLAAGLMSGLMYGASDLALANNDNKDVTFKITDVPGYWFDTGADIAGTRSLAIAAPGTTINFLQNIYGKPTAEARHTITSLLWPSNAKPGELIDQDAANQDNHHVTLRTPGLYVYVCKLHPYMLGAVIVDDKGTDGLDIGQQLTLLGVTPAGTLTFDSASDLALRLLRAFFIVTNPSNWKDYTLADAPPPNNMYQPTYPKVPVRVYLGGNLVKLDGKLPLLDNAIVAQGYDGKDIPKQKKPSINGVGEVWVDTQFELTNVKADKFPGTISVVEVDAVTNNWEVKRKIALPQQKMNNGHNMWPSHNQKQVYQTEWHGKSLFVVDRVTGKFLQEIEVGHDPAHVMTRVDTEQVHTGLNGEDGVVELNRNPVTGHLWIHRVISMQLDPRHPGKPTQPHAHWMGFDGATMATPNANTGDSSLFDFDENKVVSKLPTGALSIAVGMMPNSSFYYVSNYLGHDLSVVNMMTLPPSRSGENISMLLGYDPSSGSTAGTVNDPPCTATLLGGQPCLIGGLPIQTPVSPDGKFVVTGNTLGGTITILDTHSNKVVKVLACDPGCHGVNFGAKSPSALNPKGGYYAYVTSKFANRLIVLDYDPNGDGKADDAVIAGWVILANKTAPNDDTTTGNLGQGGQGVLPIPLVYNGWVQELPTEWCTKLTASQRTPFPGTTHPASCLR
jgi:DNA-binding beta-propeller fold protein YncE